MATRTDVDNSKPTDRRRTGAMYGLTRATITLIAAAAAGFLVWLATQINDTSTGGYWAVYGLIAGAGLVMALSQLLGGWTKWGWPRISLSVFLWAFIPVAVAVLWVFLFHQPHANWFRNHIRSWSGSIGIDGLVRDLIEYLAVLTFGLGLVFGYTFDTTGPAVERRGWRRRRTTATEPAATGPAVTDREASDAPVTRDVDGDEPVTDREAAREDRPAGRV
jgi:hypothetical protein